jgi:uncharacterized protein with PQ loop repeat
LFDTIAALLQGTVEWKNFEQYGFWNVNTLSAIGVVVTTCMEVWGLWQQNRTIWRKRSGYSVSVAMFNYTAWYFLTCGIYGTYINSAAAAFSGYATTIVQIPLIIGLWRYKEFTWWEKCLTFLLPLMPLGLIIVPTEWRGVLFVSCSIGMILAMGAEPLELWKNKKTGAVDIRLFNVYLISTTIWMIFTLSVGDTPLIINQIIITIIIVVTVVLWYWYRLREPDVPPPLLKLHQMMRKALH